MLAALESGVKGGKWFSLIDKVHARRNLNAAWEKVRGNRGAAGVDGVSIRKFARHRDSNLEQLHEWLATDCYRPLAVRRVWIPKPGTDQQRPLGIPAVKDRVVQTALRNVLEPIFESVFSDTSYGFRHGRSCKDALRRVDTLLKQGYTWVVDADIEGYFDAIDHDLLMSDVEQYIADGRVLRLLKQYLTQNVMDGLKNWTPTSGTPQGAVISPLLANLYLHRVDERLAREGLELVRYADDLVILCRTEAQARQALDVLREELAARKLTLHPEKTRLVNAELPGGFDFLGYHFERGEKGPRKKSVDRLKDKVRDLTRRTNGTSLECILTKLNPVLRGWFQYFKHTRPWLFDQLDSWIRMRLRSILRKRSGRRGRGRGRDHVRWPNAYFAERGLFTMSVAHARTRQSLRG
jgi:RNA-directed DNA polymerase